MITHIVIVKDYDPLSIHITAPSIPAFMHRSGQVGIMTAHLRGVSALDGSTKARIERAAVTLFAAHEIDGVSTKQIAHAAGVSEGAIYRHFSSKDMLARSLMIAIHTRLTDMIEVAATLDRPLSEKTHYIVRHYCAIADDDWVLFQYHILHLHHFTPLSDDPVATPLMAAAKLLKAAQDTGELGAGDPILLASMTLGIVLQSAQAKVFGLTDEPLSNNIHIFNRAVTAVLSTTQTA